MADEAPPSNYWDDFKDYLSRSAEALGRAPSDIRKYWERLPSSSGELSSIMYAPHVAADLGVRAMTHGKQGYPDFMESIGLPAPTARDSIERFHAAYDPALQTAGTVGEATGGLSGVPPMPTAKMAWAMSEPGREAFRAAAVATGGQRNVFLGPVGVENLFKAGRKAPKEAIDIAEQMKAEGYSPQEIWKITGKHFERYDPEFSGVHYGPDGSPRVELSDNSSLWTGPSREELLPKAGWTKTNIGSVWEHPTLYEAYPELPSKNMFMEAPARGYRGASAGYDPGKQQFIVRLTEDPLTQQPRDHTRSVPHEVQHYIQGVENTIAGGRADGFKVNPDRIVRILKGEQEEAGLINDMMETARRDFGFTGRTQADLVRYAQNADLSIDDLANNLNSNNSLDKYRRLYGEIEARNSGSRKNMSPAGRRATYPWVTEDYPKDRYIVDPTEAASVPGIKEHFETPSSFQSPVADLKTERGDRVMPSSNFAQNTAIRFVHPESNLSKWYSDGKINGQELYQNVKDAVSGIKSISDYIRGRDTGYAPAEDFINWARERHNPFSNNPRENKILHSIQNAEDAGFVNVEIVNGKERITITPLGEKALERFATMRFADGGIVRDPRLNYHIRSYK